MCELFAMSARFPTTVRLSFDELARHGGGTGPHRDGWGISFWHDGDALVIREPDAANDSQWVRFLHEREPRTSIAIAHIRRATQGPRSLRNTQPFSRELGGRIHLFAHNGMLPGIEALPQFLTRRFRPIGDTDSEHAFCALLERVASLWDKGHPSVEDRLRAIRAFAAELRPLGPANFLYTDGDVVFVHGDRRKHDSGDFRAPGLHVLCRSCSTRSEAVSLVGVSIDPEEHQDVALVASVPLSGEPWQPVPEGEIVMLREGRVMSLPAA
ncbi:MAG: class II glutamine amidotransferase [Myxococcales bacterium]|nr:class II glutamine amidotransferase [Myxococcales bacterium]